MGVYRADFKAMPARFVAVETEEILMLCAWCPLNGKEMKVLKPGYLKDGKASHGICKECAAIEVAKMKEA